MNEPVLDIANLTFGHTGPLTDPLSCSLITGELVAIAGRNGCGKSTLIRTLLGLRSPISGDVRISGASVSHLNPMKRAREVSVVLTDRFNSGGLTLFEVAALGRQPYTRGLGRLGTEDKRVVSNALEAMGISHLAHKRMDEVSDGERQKCLIARALSQDTSLIIMDEPLAFLDFPTKLEVLKLLQQLARGGKTILFSTHELNLITEIVDALLVFDGKEVGRIDGDARMLTAQLEKTFGTLTA